MNMPKTPKWLDPHISLGGLIQICLILILAGGFFLTGQFRLDQHDSQIRHIEARLDRLEALQISMAEVILRQEQFYNQLSRMEARLQERNQELRTRVSELEREIRALEGQLRAQ